MKFKFIFSVSLCVMVFLGFSFMAMSQDDPTVVAPTGETNGSYEETAPSESYVTTQTIGDAPGMDEYRWFDQDFGWTHTFDPGCKEIKYVRISIRAWDVDAYWDNEVNRVYADGVYLGDLEGTSDEWSITYFNVDPALAADGKLNIWVDIDALHEEPFWAMTIDWSCLRVRWEWLPPVVDFDTDVNIGVGELSLNFTNLSQCFRDCIWEFGDGDSVSDLFDPHRIFKTGSYDITLSIWGHEPWFGVPVLNREDFIVVYDPKSAPVDLEIVDCSPSYKDEPWANAIDRDFWYWNGTATIDAKLPAYCNFQFKDTLVHKLDKIRLLVDTGVDFQARWLRDFELLTSLDGANYSLISFADTLITGRWTTYVFKQPVNAKFVKLNLLGPTDHWWIQIGEFEVWEVEKMPPAIQVAKQLADKPVNVAEAVTLTGFALMQNYPNPFNPKTDISYQIPEAIHVTLKIFNMRGEEVRSLVDEPKNAGAHTVAWNSLDNFGNKVSSGVYVYRLDAGQFTCTRKMAMLK